jgi:hypothetical protein
MPFPSPPFLVLLLACVGCCARAHSVVAEEVQLFGEAALMGSFETLKSPAFWTSLAPDLTIWEHESGLMPANASFSCDLLDKRRFIKKGYSAVRASRIGEADRAAYDRVIRALAEVATKLVDMDLPPVFLFVYREPWLFVTRWINPCLKGFFMEDYRVLPAIWAWYVTQTASAEADRMGWSAHRDRQTASIPDKRKAESSSVFQSTSIVSVWLALSKATPTSGCISLLPKDADPYLSDPRLATGSPPYPYRTLDVATNETIAHINFQLERITALPAERGDWLTWDQRLLHWGGHSSEDEPRISLAFEAHRADIADAERPEFSSVPDFAMRLWVSLLGVTRYTHMYDMGDKLEQFAKDFIQEARSHTKHEHFW